MPSQVAAAFRRHLAPAVWAISNETLRPPEGPRAYGEIDRALLLTDRAVHEWAGPALARVRPERNSFESLPRLSTLAVAHAALSGALDAERSAARGNASQTSLVGAVATLARALDQLEFPSPRDDVTLDQVGAAAAKVLILSSAFLGAVTCIADQANETLHDLAAEAWPD